MSDPFAEDAGAYVLGALSDADRAAFVEHLRGCVECRQAVADVEDLPGLLALVPAEGPVDPPASVLSGLLAEVERLEQADQLAARRAARGRRWWTGAGLAAAAAAGVVLSGQLVPMPWTDGAPVVVAAATTTVQLTSEAPVPITASVDLTAVRWGTKVDVTCSYQAGQGGQGGQYAAGAEYALILYDAAGGTEEVATWTVVPGVEMNVPAATATPLDQITRVEMVSVSGGTVVLSGEVVG